MLLASYPAGFLGSIAVQKDLYQTSTTANIKDIFTFQSGLVDLFSVGGNAVAQKGSSGSAVVDLNTGRVLGIIVTSSKGETTAERDLHAIVFAHMSESMKKDIGFTLEEFLSGDPSAEAALFQKTSPLPFFCKSSRNMASPVTPPRRGARGSRITSAGYEAGSGKTLLAGAPTGRTIHYAAIHPRRQADGVFCLQKMAMVRNAMAGIHQLGNLG